MDIFNDALVDLWRSFSKNELEYIMVGGFAVNIQGFTRTTEDVDIYLHDTLENRKKFRKALKEANIGDYESIETMQFLPGWTSFQINNGMQLDILTSLNGVTDSFAVCYAQATFAEIYDFSIPFLHINHLIENKRKVNRPKDQIDIIELEKIRAFRNISSNNKEQL